MTSMRVYAHVSFYYIIGLFLLMSLSACGSLSLSLCPTYLPEFQFIIFTIFIILFDIHLRFYLPARCYMCKSSRIHTHRATYMHIHTHSCAGKRKQEIRFRCGDLCICVLVHSYTRNSYNFAYIKWLCSYIHIYMCVYGSFLVISLSNIKTGKNDTIEYLDPSAVTLFW